MSGGLGSRTTTPLGIENFGDGKRSWSHYAQYLEDRCVRAEEALRQAETELRRLYREKHHQPSSLKARVYADRRVEELLYPAGVDKPA